MQPRTATYVGGAVGFVSFLAAWSTASLYLVNSEGPLGDRDSMGALLAFGSALAMGSLTGLLTAALSRVSRVGAAFMVVLVGVAVWQLHPTRTDVHESFVSRPNHRWSCTGWSFSTYPPHTMDASSEVYCVGFEHRLPDG